MRTIKKLVLFFYLILFAVNYAHGEKILAKNFWEWLFEREKIQEDLSENKSGERIKERIRMVENQIHVRGVNNPLVLEALKNVPRHLFVPAEQAPYAYYDSPLPIGYGQTISQPYIVAFMTELLNVKEGDRVLEVGTGSGYQAAVLAEIGVKVFTVEIIKDLADRAENTIEKLEYHNNITVYNSDGFYGLPKHSPFDGIIVTAVAGSIPPPLIKQLKKGGRMVIPVGPPHGTQHLIVVNKDKAGKIETLNVLPVRFVPLTRNLR